MRSNYIGEPDTVMFSEVVNKLRQFCLGRGVC